MHPLMLTKFKKKSRIHDGGVRAIALTPQQRNDRRCVLITLQPPPAIVRNITVKNA